MTGPDFELHRLGWSAFQDLSAVVLQQVLGQTFHTFADSKDAGRDGAFYGAWSLHDDTTVPEGDATVVQCKFSAKPTGTLTPSMVKDEIAKVEALHQSGICDAYLLMTNLRVSARTEAWLVREAKAFGVRTVLILDGRWMCQQIAKSEALRRYVPRVYGLGDLGQILDDRRLRQARALLRTLEDDLGTFVPTDSYRRASDALAAEGFVVLLGEPACGKSTIAAALALAALDSWHTSVKRVDSAAELVDAWDVDDPRQLFWVDDAFGAILHDATLTDGWSRRMDQVMAAVEGGARVILTSRDYIYREARDHLKEYAYPRLRENQVVINVSDLTQPEKRQILYNHLKAGDQTREVLEKWRPHLAPLTEVDRFQPEVARRLAHRAFTSASRPATAAELRYFFEHPVEMLRDVLRQVGSATQAALACVYMAGDALASPVVFSAGQQDAITRLGATDSTVIRALNRANGTFLRLTDDVDGNPIYRFRHPTIREGLAAVVAESPETVAVFINGLTEDEIVTQLDCGDEPTKGVVVRVPPSLYDAVIPRVRMPDTEGPAWLNARARFLTYSCSDEFLRRWAAYHQADLALLARFGIYVEAYWEPTLAARLHRAGALPEAVRSAVVKELREAGLDFFDLAWLATPAADVFTDDERDDLFAEIRGDVLPSLRDHIYNSGDGYSSDTEPEDRFRAATEALDVLARFFDKEPPALSQIHEAREYVTTLIDEAQAEYRPRGGSSSAWAPTPAPSLGGQRDPFDDVAEGR